MRWLLTTLMILALGMSLSCSVTTTATPGTMTSEQTPAPAQVKDAVAAEREHEAEEVLESIKGRENLPAEQVFKNIKIFKGTPARRFVNIMNVGYATSLGVSCEHCHNEKAWDSDEKQTKKIARDMAEMMRRINTEILAPMASLGDRKPMVNCTTCHRGQTKPATSMR